MLLSNCTPHVWRGTLALAVMGLFVHVGLAQADAPPLSPKPRRAAAIQSERPERRARAVRSAEPTPAERKAPQLSRLEQRRRKLAASAEAAQSETRAGKSDGRYQMLAAGKRVVVLDTHTGETRIIEPESGQAIQNVEVGRAWVVVTVLGNVSQHESKTNDEE